MGHIHRITTGHQGHKKKVPCIFSCGLDAVATLCCSTMSGYTQEKICNLNHHCNDDCNSSLEWSDLTHKRKIRNLNDHCNDDCNLSLECEFSRGMSLCINTYGKKSQGHVSLASQKMIWMFFAYTHRILTVILSETSLEFTSGLEFEFVIVISIRDANLRTHMLKIRH